MHHFRILGVDVDKTFTVAGIGDMAGDVFGNGMLRSATRLVAAFNHQHIFLDPPRSGRELRRAARGSSICHARRGPTTTRRRSSAGGGIFERSAKEIPLGQEASALLDFEAEALERRRSHSPLLTMPVDLLCNGRHRHLRQGGGEDNAEVGDRANDRVRVDAAELRARVIGEGGNLGLTQAARLETGPRAA